MYEPLFVVLCAAAVWLYWRDVRRFPEGRPGTGRQIVFAAGLLLIVLPLNSPLETVSAHYLLMAHLLQNAMVADWAPILLLVGLSPAMRRRIAARGGSPFAWITRPQWALLVWVTAWYGVHVPAFYDWALRAGWPLNLEHLILIGAGLIFWWPVFEEPRRLRPLAVSAYLGVAFLASPWLSLALTFSGEPFYAFYTEAPRLWGISAVKDQNLAGVLMNLEQTAVFFIAFAWAFLHVLDEEEREQRERDAAFVLASASEEPPPT
jgi:cytochrome c oxidase assembly factor CtaG